MLAKRLTDQFRAIQSRASGGTVSGFEQLRVQYNLDGFHTVDSTPQSVPQSIRSSCPGDRNPKRITAYSSVCASTDSTRGRCSTMADHVSPPSAEPYTSPLVVPK